MSDRFQVVVKFDRELLERVEAHAKGAGLNRMAAIVGLIERGLAAGVVSPGRVAGIATARVVGRAGDLKSPTCFTCAWEPGLVPGPVRPLFGGKCANCGASGQVSDLTGWRSRDEAQG